MKKKNNEPLHTTSDNAAGTTRKGNVMRVAGPVITSKGLLWESFSLNRIVCYGYAWFPKLSDSYNIEIDSFCKICNFTSPSIFSDAFLCQYAL